MTRESYVLRASRYAQSVKLPVEWSEQRVKYYRVGLYEGFLAGWRNHKDRKEQKP